MTDALLADLRALAEKWRHPGLTCEPWDDVHDDLTALIAKHAPKPDVSERVELTLLILGRTATSAADAILAAGWRRT